MSTATIIPDPAKAKRLDIKRFYLPFILRDNCPKCGERAERSFITDSDYLSYPTINAPMDVSIECGACEHLWFVPVVLTFGFTVGVAK